MLELWGIIITKKKKIQVITAFSHHTSDCDVFGLSGPRDICKGHVERSCRSPHFCLVSCSHSRSAAEQTMTGWEESQTPHPACVKINLLKGGDLCVFSNHGNFNGHATDEDCCVLIKAFHYTVEHVMHPGLISVSEKVRLFPLPRQPTGSNQQHISSVMFFLPLCACHRTD